MARHGFLGHKLRRLRRQQGMTQVAMAEQLGISPSYLNLIEHNQRSLTLPLIAKLSEQLGVDLQSFSGSEEARLLAELTELLSDPLFDDRPVKRSELNDVVGSAPALCQAVLQLYRRYRQAREEVQGLSQRLTEDPFLSESSHRLLTLLTSVRSFSEILQDNVGLADTKRQEFAGILVQESEKLTDLVNELFEFIRRGGLGADSDGELPAEAVSEIIQANNNYFPELEAPAAALAAEVGERDSLTHLGDLLRRNHDVALEVHPAATFLSDGQPDGESGDAPAGAPASEEGEARDAGRSGTYWRFEPESRRLLLAETLPMCSRVFQAARHLGLLSQEATIEAQLNEAALSSPKAAALYRDVLGNYFAGAFMMPYDAFLAEAQRLRYDLELLGQRFDASFEQVCHRLTTLQRPGQEGVPFHFMRVDVAGNVLKRFSASGLNLPRYGGVCPLWNLHAAFLTPGRIDRQLATFPDGSSYLFVARAVAKPGRGYLSPPCYHSIGIGCHVSFAPQLVYADGLDLDRKGAATPVGINCRQCERLHCDQRAFPRLLQ